MRRFVIGDIHGGYRALLQVLDRADFDLSVDMLISLGDVVDGWPQVRECVEYLVNLPNCVFVLGNHDKWFVDWLQTGNAPDIWTSQGGRATLESYSNSRDAVPESHRDFFLDASPYYILDKKVFVHGGLDPDVNPAIQHPDFLTWDRSLFGSARRAKHTNPTYRYGPWEKIFIGHTTTLVMHEITPQVMCNVIAMDTGGGWEGKLSLMDIDTGSYWQSSFVHRFYPDHAGRR